MKQKLIKPVVKMGNSACVMLPKSWLNGRAKIELVEGPVDVNKDVFGILKDYLKDVVGIYVVGSYGRKEESVDSDVDILVLTNGVDKRIESGKYEMILISVDNLEKQLKKNILPLLPMIKEARGLVNSGLIDKYRATKLTKKNLRFHFETTVSAMKVVEKSLDLSRELGESAGDDVAYSLVLRMREIYIVGCLMKNRIWKKAEFLKLVKSVSGSLVAYGMYVAVKANKKSGNALDVDVAEKMREWILKKLEEQKKFYEKK